jgi:NAD(P)-dependent dehydrogenase (short-subunit alcohol dehydrogenase family)
VHTRKVDAGDEKHVAAVVDDALKLYGRLDIFFANAGINISYQSILQGSAEDFMETMRVNALRYVTLVCRSELSALAC